MRVVVRPTRSQTHTRSGIPIGHTIVSPIAAETPKGHSPIPRITGIPLQILTRADPRGGIELLIGLADQHTPVDPVAGDLVVVGEGTRCDAGSVEFEHGGGAEPTDAAFAVEFVVLALPLHTFGFGVPKGDYLVAALVQHPQLGPVRVDHKGERTLEADTTGTANPAPRLVHKRPEISIRDGVAVIVVEIVGSHEEARVVVPGYLGDVVDPEDAQFAPGRGEPPVARILDEGQRVVGRYA